jgi:hypothetical protein
VRESIVHIVRDDPTPYGYTISLMIYLAPVATLITWFYRNHPPDSFRRRAFRWTLILLVPLGFGLDFLLGNLFFTFPNAGATLRIYLPGYSFATGGFVWDLPIEEFVFYFSGFVAILLLYIWCNEVWVPAYGVADYGDTASHPPYIIRIHWQSLWWGVALMAAAVIHKKYLAPVTEHRDYREGFPLYFLFLLVAGVLPSMLLYRCARAFVNWRAFSITLLWVLLTSLLWEATLASPFGWWRYRAEWMMGLHIKAWSDLPIEAVVLWLVVAGTTILVFETIKVYLHMRQPPREAFFGSEAASTRA